MKLKQKTEISIEERIQRLEVEPDLSEYDEVIDTMNKGEYHLSYSAIREFSKSPLHFLRYKTEEIKLTASMEYGSLVHLLILEPHKFHNKYIVLRKAEGFQENTWSKSENKLKKQETEEEALNSNKTIVKIDDLESALQIKELLLANSFISQLIRGCHTFEKPISWEYLGHDWRGYIDGVSHNYIIDIKQVPDANPSKLKWKMFERKWSWQSFLYLKGFGFGMDKHFYNICYDKGGNTSVIKQSWFDMSSADAEIRKAVDELSDCIIGENWFFSYEFNTENGYYNSDEL